MLRTTRLLFAAAAAAVISAAAAQAQEVKIGALYGITGPIASLVPPIVASTKLAVQQVNEQGGILHGRKLDLVMADGQCNPQAAAAAAKKLVDVDKVVGLVGELCSGATIAAAESASIPSGVVQISPASTSPVLTSLKDKDFVFRTCASDLFVGEATAQYLIKRGIKRLALTYMNNDYGRGLASSFRTAYKKLGGTITADLEHNEKATSFRSELATLAKGHPPYLYAIAYANSSGPVIIRQALEGGFFKKFIGSEGIRDPKLYKQIGIKNLEGTIMIVGGNPAGKTTDTFNAWLGKINPKYVGQPYTPHSYDAAFILALAIEQAGSTDRVKVRDALRKVGSPGGVVIEPGQWKKAVAAIAQKKKITYHGAACPCYFDKAGDVTGVADVYEIKGGKEVKITSIK